MIDTLAAAFDASWRQLVFGLGPVFALGAMLYAVQWATHRQLVKAIGFRGIVIWTGWIGTPVHEFSHYLVGRLFGLRILEVRPFAPDRDTGVLGYVRYTKPELRLGQLHKVIGTFAMGIAPLFGGSLVLAVAWALLVNPSVDGRYAAELRSFVDLASSGGIGDAVSGFVDLAGSLYEAVFRNGAGDWRAWVFLYVALAVGAHLAPSRADLEGGLVGFIVLFVLGLVANVVAVLMGADPADAVGVLARGSAEVAALLVLTLVLNLGNLGLASLLAMLRRGS